MSTPAQFSFFRDAIGDRGVLIDDRGDLLAERALLRDHGGLMVVTHDRRGFRQRLAVNGKVVVLVQTLVAQTQPMDGNGEGDLIEVRTPIGKPGYLVQTAGAGQPDAVKVDPAVERHDAGVEVGGHVIA